MWRWLDGGFRIYQRSGRFAPLLGPLLWTADVLSPLLHSLYLTLVLSVCVLYYNVSVNNGLRRRLQTREGFPDWPGETPR